VLVPLTSRVDALDCTVALTVGIGDGRRRAGTLDIGSGTVRIDQVARGDRQVLTRMRSADCGTAATSDSGEAVISRFRRLRYRRRFGRIAFPAEVRVDAAVMTTQSRVATWTVDDRCGRSATIRVSSGRLAVLDLGRDRTVVIGPGDQYTSLAP
jgi:hypothetical protein